MDTPEKHPASDRLLIEILQRIAELNRQLPPVEESSLLTNAAQLSPGPAPSTGIGENIRREHSRLESVERDRSAESPLGADLPSENAPSGGSALLWLEQMGLLPAYAGHILEHLRGEGSGTQSCLPEEELPPLRALLRSRWRPPPPSPLAAPTESHVFVGPAGVGKTTVLSKWLAQAVLLGGRSACVWRLDGRTANTAEALTVYAEILGVPIARAWSGEGQPVDVQFFDLPGVDWREAAAVAELREKVQGLEARQIHLVLNAAYETPLLLEQVRVFSSWPVTDLIFTHLDEETRWGKLWNFVLGTDLPIRFLSAGQNVPGHFREATVDLLLPGGLD